MNVQDFLYVLRDIDVDFIEEFLAGMNRDLCETDEND